jgi:phosphoribosylformylglycinamidine synthase
MSLSESDRQLIVVRLGRDPTPAEAALFENLWSEHCAYRSSRPLLGAFDAGADDDRVVVGPGDDAAVVALPGDRETYLAIGIESHNHPSYVDPYDGAATGVGGIVRDVMSMGAYPVALSDSLYFGAFDREHSRYLFEGVVEGIADYGNAIGVPTVTGSVDFHPDYEGNPLVNVGCVGLVTPDRLVTGAATEPGNRLVLVGNATGRDGLGGASFASEDLDEDAETEDRPAVQVGDPYTEKLLIEATEVLLDRDLVEAARDLGAAGLGGATSEMAAQGGLGAHLRLDVVHQREPGMNAVEILLAESQERMCYEVRPGNVAAVRSVAERFDLGCSVVGNVTEGNYVCTIATDRDGDRDRDGNGTGNESGNRNGNVDETKNRRTVVDVPAEFLADGAPTAELDRHPPDAPDRDRPDADPVVAFDAVVSSPNTASKRWVYGQYDHEVGVRTAVGPGGDAAVLAIREAETEGGVGLAITSGGAPYWTDAAPRDGARAVVVENATNLAVTGARPLAAVDCLNGGNPEKPHVYGGFAAVVEGLAAMCRELSVPVVGGNVSLYNDSPTGPIPPTPTVFMVGVREGYEAPATTAVPGAELLLVGRTGTDLGGSEYLARHGGSDRFPALPDDPAGAVDRLAAIANADETLAVHDVSQGGLAVTLAEMVGGAGVRAELPGENPAGELFGEAPGRAVVATTDPGSVRERAGDRPVERLGEGIDDAALDLTVGDRRLWRDASEIAALRRTIDDELG